MWLLWHSDYTKIQFRLGLRPTPRWASLRHSLPSPPSRLLRGILESLKNVTNFAASLDDSKYKGLQLHGVSLPGSPDLTTRALPLDPAGGFAADPVIGSRSVLVMVPHLSLTPQLPILKNRPNCIF